MGRNLTAELQCSPGVTGTPVVTGSRCHALAKAAASAVLVRGRMAYKRVGCSQSERKREGRRKNGRMEERTTLSVVMVFNLVLY
jgi:hypothetical protein